MNKILILTLMLLAATIAVVGILAINSNTSTEHLVQKCWDLGGAFYSDSGNGFICVDSQLRIVDIGQQHSLALEKIVTE